MPTINNQTTCLKLTEIRELTENRVFTENTHKFVCTCVFAIVSKNTPITKLPSAFFDEVYEEFTMLLVSWRKQKTKRTNPLWESMPQFNINFFSFLWEDFILLTIHATTAQIGFLFFVFFVSLHWLVHVWEWAGSVDLTILFPYSECYKRGANPTVVWGNVCFAGRMLWGKGYAADFGGFTSNRGER